MSPHLLGADDRGSAWIHFPSQEATRNAIGVIRRTRLADTTVHVRFSLGSKGYLDGSPSSSLVLRNFGNDLSYDDIAAHAGGHIGLEQIRGPFGVPPVAILDFMSPETAANAREAMIGQNVVPGHYPASCFFYHATSDDIPPTTCLILRNIGVDITYQELNETLKADVEGFVRVRICKPPSILLVCAHLPHST